MDRLECMLYEDLHRTSKFSQMCLEGLVFGCKTAQIWLEQGLHEHVSTVDGHALTKLLRADSVSGSMTLSLSSCIQKIARKLRLVISSNNVPRFPSRAYIICVVAVSFTLPRSCSIHQLVTYADRRMSQLGLECSPNLRFAATT